MIDRSVRGASLDAAKTAAQHVYDSLDDWDMAALMTFDGTVDTPMHAGHINSRRKQFKRALARVTSGQGRDLVAALLEARDYMTCSPDQKVIVLLTEEVDVDNNVLGALRELRESYVWLIVVGLPGTDRKKLFTLAREPGVVAHILDGEPNSAWRGVSLENVRTTVVGLRRSLYRFAHR